MKITLALLSLGMASWAMGSSKIDEGYINPYCMAELDTQLTSIQTSELSLSANSAMLGISALSSGVTKSLSSDDVLAGSGELIFVHDRTLTDDATLTAINGGTIDMDNVTLDLSTYSSHFYAIGPVDKIFTLNLSEIFTNGLASEGGYYTGNLNIKITDESMYKLINAYYDGKILGVNILVDFGQVLNLDSLMLSSNHAFITFSCEQNTGTGDYGELIPEPSTASLSLLALASLLARRRRRALKI